MVVGDLVDYLRQHLALGYNMHDLKLQLVRYGHSPKMVEEAIDILKKAALDALPSPAIPRSITSQAHIWFLMPAMLFMLLFTIAIVVSLLRNPLL